MNRIVFAALFVSLAGCRSEVIGPVAGRGPLPRAAVATVEITALSGSVEVTSSLEVTATVRDAAGNPLLDRTVSWSSSDSTVATVFTTGSQTASIRPLRVGLVTISAAAEGRSGLLNVTTTPEPPAPVLRAFIYSAEGGMAEIERQPGTTIRPTDINEAGQVVGSLTFGSTQRAFVWSKEKGVLDLGVLPGWDMSIATAINNSGEVVGTLLNASPRGPITATRAFKWTAGTGMVLLPSLPELPNTQASDINNTGDIVGFAVTSIANFTGVRPVRWTSAKGLEDLGTLPGHHEGRASSINDAGQIVGYSSNVDYYDSDNVRSVLWTPGDPVVDISGCSDTCEAEARAINQAGQIVGTSNTRAFRWTKTNGLTYLPPVDAQFTAAFGINSLDDVIVSQSSPGNPSKAFVWTTGRALQSLGALPGASYSQATAINDRGQIVGTSW